MQIRRIMDFDGGNFLVLNKLQYRTAETEPWVDVPTMTSQEALIQDVAQKVAIWPDTSNWAPDYAEQFREQVEALRADRDRAE